MPRDHTSVSAIANDLVRRIQDGDATAFETLFRTYSAAVLHYTLGLVADRDTAEDVVQDVFGAVWARRAQWQPEGNVLGYLIGAARKSALHRARAGKVRANSGALHEQLGTSPGASQPIATPDREAESRDSAEFVWRAVLDLPDPRRTILLLRWERDLAWDELARLVGLSVSAAKMQYARALDSIRARLPEVFE